MNLLRALAAVSSLTMVSRVLGYVRDFLIARVFGAGLATDAFFVAFKIPNLLRRMFAEGAFSQAFVPVLVESSFYALSMGSIILFVMHRFVELVPGLSTSGELAAALASGLSFLDVVVISAGAGLHEELIFRLIGVGGLSWLLAGAMDEKQAWVVAVIVSSLVFSLAHHVGPHGEPFVFAAFVYRSLAGLFFALVYQIRGLAVAVWTHAIYDVYVLTAAG